MESGTNSGDGDHGKGLFSKLLVRSERVRRQRSGFLAFFLNRLLSKQSCLRTAITSSACDLKAAFSRMWRETAMKASTISSRVWYSVGMVERGGGAVVERCLALLCALAVESERC